MRLLCVVVLAACSGAPRGRASAPAHPHSPPASDHGPTGAGSEPRSDAARDCDKLIAHAVELGAAERPDDQKPTADERASMQAQLRTSWGPNCEAMTSRGYDCALAATSLAALDACGG